MVVILVGSASFGLGRLSVDEINKDPIRLYDGADILFEEKILKNSKSGGAASAVVILKEPNEEGRVVASKNSDKYHLPWCSGAARIKEENKVWFNSKEEAEASGYSPAANCPGL